MALVKATQRFVLIDGTPKKVPDDAPVNPVGRGVALFVHLQPNGSSIKAEPFKASDLKLAAERVGRGILGAPVGRIGEAIVFRVIHVK